MNADDLEVGAFYWTLPTNDPDATEDWEVRRQPARYAGNGRWNYLGVEGESDWPPAWVGAQIALTIEAPSA